jgi:hypothetical protein
MKLAAGRRAWQCWQAAAGPWRGWSICPTLLSPGFEELADAPRPSPTTAVELAAALEAVLEPGGALCLLELDPVLGVQTAARLAGLAHPVLVLPRWPYAQAILTTRRLAATLLAESKRLPRSAERRSNVVIVVDADRTRPVPDRRPGDPRADNRHTLSVFELPTLATLQARGIHRIHRIARA